LREETHDEGPERDEPTEVGALPGERHLGATGAALGVSEVEEGLVGRRVREGPRWPSLQMSAVWAQGLDVAPVGVVGAQDDEDQQQGNQKVEMGRRSHLYLEERMALQMHLP